MNKYSTLLEEMQALKGELIFYLQCSIIKKTLVWLIATSNVSYAFAN